VHASKAEGDFEFRLVTELRVAAPEVRDGGHRETPGSRRSEIRPEEDFRSRSQEVCGRPRYKQGRISGIVTLIELQECFGRHLRD
jgi:hypothetical protein